MKHRIIALIQARMGSTRLPGKVMKKINGKTVIEIIYERVKAAKKIDDIVLAIPGSKENDVLVAEGKRIGVKTFRFAGNENDVISRYLGAIEYMGGADAMLRVTADCVFVDPALVDQLVRVCREKFERYDYFTNICPPSFPDGFDLEIFPMRTLNALNKELRSIHGREWFSLYVGKHSKRFRTYNLRARHPHTDMRVVIDFPEDLTLARKIYSELAPRKKVFSFRDIINLLKQKPEFRRINAKYLGYVSKPV
ncbi:MAG: hypothetical protein A3B24_00110 [Candidatus Wildermuthbacteria bacterium RIFCSPLOWO2_01_FULL_48_16]|uniref:Acylneuraminate cytidylyltransferase n=1 Tax=Candidatus Wildermuthbacteria bacterium RIFCSPLOWO2_01_FULL_48_16 TaxID=1802461 RepID=A0A1G2RNI8_9BACT|nr:MAG: hypothetical protein A3B24_00110 [Candidatus Wildermuthbacteria bacterium RIFCSPLOWO2_01_FULL_48_16]